VTAAARCEVCCTRLAAWTILPMPGGQGVDCCAVCYARQPAAALDLWRLRNNKPAGLFSVQPAQTEVQEEGTYDGRRADRCDGDATRQL